MYDIPKVYFLTDSRCDPTNRGLSEAEPEVGSVVLLNGLTGIAYQRQAESGQWHRAGGGAPRSWDWIMGSRSVCLVYPALARKSN